MKIRQLEAGFLYADGQTWRSLQSLFAILRMLLKRTEQALILTIYLIHQQKAHLQ